MKNLSFFLLIVLVLTKANSFAQQAKNVLIFSKTTGFRHNSIPKGVRVVTNLLTEQGIKSFHTEDAAFFCQDSLNNYDAVLFLSTTGDIFTTEQKAAFQAFIQVGNGYVGIHAASDTEFNWPWYGQLVGGYFSSHPSVQEAKIEVQNRKHPATKHLQRVWFHKDEWYDFKDVKEGLNILMTLDEGSYKGGKMGKFHPIAWFQEFDGGRSFYTGLGHTEESFDSIDFQKHIVGGVKYVLKLN